MHQNAAREIVPEHMDKWSRNARLYETLKGMGLFVVPVPEKDDATRIAYLTVGCGAPDWDGRMYPDGEVTKMVMDAVAHAEGQVAAASSLVEPDGNVVPFKP